MKKIVIWIGLFNTRKSLEIVSVDKWYGDEINSSLKHNLDQTEKR